MLAFYACDESYEDVAFYVCEACETDDDGKAWDAGMAWGVFGQTVGHYVGGDGKACGVGGTDEPELLVLEAFCNSSSNWCGICPLAHISLYKMACSSKEEEKKNMYVCM